MASVQESPADLAARPPSEHTLTLRDGTALFYRAWLPPKPATNALLLFHRGHEHSGRWQDTVASLALDEVAVFAWDQRGHGRSSGDRGSAPDLATVVRDADEWATHLTATRGVALENTVVVAHSVGAVIAAAWVHDYAPPVRGLVLATPAFRVKLYVPFAVPFLRLKQKLLGPGYVSSYITPAMLTHDPEQAKRYAADPLVFRQIAVNVLLDLHDTATRLLDDAGAITTPLLVLAAGTDWVVKEAAQRQFVERAASPIKRFAVLPDFKHALFHETHRQRVVDEVRTFVRERFDAPPPAAKPGLMQAEYDRLRRPGGWQFAPVRWLMKGPGRLSRGIDLGWKHGFDSGISLDHVYENRAHGITPVGRLIDRLYLDAVGWRGIRVRRQLLERALRTLVEQTHAAGRPVRILDIAAGPGRYVLETLHALPTIPAAAVLRDYKQENLDAAARLRDRLGVANVAVTLGDAFDEASLAAVAPRPTVAIASGIYELIPDDAQVLRSLRGLAAAVEPGGHLIYTNQPWHPQIEFIARVLVNREGNPWIMRRRPQAETDALVRAAGFRKVSQEVDPTGLFTVSVARRGGG